MTQDFCTPLWNGKFHTRFLKIDILAQNVQETFQNSVTSLKLLTLENLKYHHLNHQYIIS